MAAKKVMTIVGARPQFIKAAAISRAIEKEPRIVEGLIHTGQHYDANMSDVFFEELSIPTPARHLGISGGSHGVMTGRMLEALEMVMQADDPDAVIVYGDTNSTLAGALAAAKLHIPVIHVEAGMRSFNQAMPEEINRVLTDHVSSLLLCSTKVAVANLEREAVRGDIRHVGDVMYDAALYARTQAQKGAELLRQLGIDGTPFALCTIHRAENTDDPVHFESLIRYIERYSDGHKIVFPVHPRTRKLIEDKGMAPARALLIDPVGYFDMHLLLANCALVLTDSGGVQKEAYFHRKPCITLRDETEWVETVEAGWNRLWTAQDWKSPRQDIEDYGAGQAAEACVAAILEHLS